MPNYFATILFCISFFIQNNLMFTLASKIIDYRVNHHFVKVVSAVNVVVVTYLLANYADHTPVVYMLVCFVFVVDMFFLFKANFAVIISCALALPIHVMAIRNIVVSIYQIVTGGDIAMMMNSDTMYWNSLTITSVICCLFVISLFFIIPDRYFKMMNQDMQRMSLFMTISTIASIRLIINGIVYQHNYTSTTMPIQQIATGVGWMVMLYTGVFMLVGFELIDANKEKMQNRLARENMYRKAMLSNSDRIIEVNCSDDTILFYASNGVTKEEMIGTSFSEHILSTTQSSVYSKDKAGLYEKAEAGYFVKSYDRGDIELDVEYRLLNSEQVYRWHRATINLEMNKLTGQLVAIVIIEDIHEEKIHAIELKNKSERDPLVGAYNKVTIEKLVDEHINSGGIGALLMIDLDNFKGVNDSFGHSYGDKVLCEVNTKLGEIFRDEDLIGRIGGDEFVVYLKETIDIDIVTNKAHKVCSSLKKTYYIENKPGVTVSTSVGVSFVPKDGNSFSKLFDKADVAMYSSKKAGKNTFKFYDESMQKH